jgi:hypothetical protein
MGQYQRVAMNTRKELLLQLLTRSRPMKSVLEELAEYGWDSDRDLVVVTRHYLMLALQEFTDGHLSAADLVSWAEALEAREDVGFESGYEELVKCVVFTLANPEINHPLTLLKAARYIQQLSKS